MMKTKLDGVFCAVVVGMRMRRRWRQYLKVMIHLKITGDTKICSVY